MRFYSLRDALVKPQVKLIRRNRFFDEGENNNNGGGNDGGNDGGGANDDPPGANNSSSGNSGSGGSNNPVNGGGNNRGRTYTQDEVNRMMKNDRDRAKRERDETIAQLEKLKEQGVTAENLDSLNQRIEQLQNANKTKEELQRQEAEKKEKDWAKKLKTEQDAVGIWKNRYVRYRTQKEILDAAGKYKAFNPNQILGIVESWTHMVEETNAEGKATGDYIPRVKFRDEKDGQPIELDLSVDEAIKRMTEMEIHSNLFNSGVSGGLGGHTHGRNNGGGTAAPKNMAEYMEARKRPGFLSSIGGKK